MAYEKKEYKKRIGGVTICDTMLNISSKGILDNSRNQGGQELLYTLLCA